jgi:hypothetical protein
MVVYPRWQLSLLGKKGRKEAPPEDWLNPIEPVWVSGEVRLLLKVQKAWSSSHPAPTSNLPVLCVSLWGHQDVATLATLPLNHSEKPSEPLVSPSRA